MYRNLQIDLPNTHAAFSPAARVFNVDVDVCGPGSVVSFVGASGGTVRVSLTASSSVDDDSLVEAARQLMIHVGSMQGERSREGGHAESS